MQLRVSQAVGGAMSYARDRVPVICRAAFIEPAAAKSPPRYASIPSNLPWKGRSWM